MRTAESLAYLPGFDRLPAAMKEVKPAIFLAVPRVFEKVRQGVEGKAHGMQKRILMLGAEAGPRAEGRDRCR